MSEITAFNVRVYGILLNENRELLLTDEFRFGRLITKFPGGGLQFGEGTIDCIRREMLEETGMEIEVVKHFYTTDFFQQSAFDETHQVISIYYIIRATAPIQLTVKDKPQQLKDLKDGAQSFRWIQLKELKKEDLSMPIDQIVAEKLKQQLEKN